MNLTHVDERKMLKRNFNFPPELLERAERLATANSATLSQLVRKALEEYVVRMEREEIEQEIVRACTLNRGFDREFAADWAKVETKIE